jgi:arginine/ornithine transport system substrate-binding protein
MRRSHTVTIAIAVSLAASSAQTASAQALKLKLGNEGTYPPFSMTGADGSLSGLEPDLAREMCKRLGADCEIVPMDFKMLLPSLTEGKIDMIVSQLTPLPERLEASEFTIPIILNPEGFVVPKSWDRGYDDAAFKGKRIGVPPGTSLAKYVQEQLPGAIPVLVGSSQIKNDLLAGKLDATFGHKIYWRLNLIDKPEGQDWKLSEPDFWAAGKKVGMSWAVRKGDKSLLAKVNEALGSMVADCTYTRIRKQYLSMQLLPKEAKCM